MFSQGKSCPAIGFGEFSSTPKFESSVDIVFIGFVFGSLSPDARNSTQEQDAIFIGSLGSPSIRFDPGYVSFFGASSLMRATRST